MSPQKKTSSVTKKLTQEEVLNNQRWKALMQASQIPLGDLPVVWEKFFDAVYLIKPVEEIEKAIDAAIKADKK